MNKKGVGPVLGYIGMGVLIAGVAVFLGGHSLNFFQISFSKGQQAYAPLGLLLTEGGLFIWLAIFLWVAKSALQKGIALTMLLISLVGGMATAVFDIYFETASGAIGYQLTLEEIKAMSMVVGALAVAHGLAMIGELAGNRIIEAFGDADGDGVPNFADRDYKGNQNKGSNAPKSRQEAPQQPKTNFTIADLERVANMSINEVVRQHPYKKAFKDFAAEKFDYIDGDNLQELWIARPANPTQAAAQNNGRR